MGICGSVSFELNPDLPAHNNITLETFEKIGLTKSEINKLYKNFLKVDVDNSYYLYPAEIYSYLKMEPNEFNKRLLAAFDLEKTGRLNFLEYGCAMWNFLSMDAGYLGSLAFVIFDKDGSNSLDYSEVKQLVEIIHHKKYETNEGVRSLVDGLKDISHTINVEQFSKFSKDNPTLCAPLVGLQFILRKRVVGDSFWNALADRRYSNAEQNNCKYTSELCKHIIRRYEKAKLDKAVESKRLQRTLSLKRIADAKSSEVVASRNNKMLGFFSMGEGVKREEILAKAKLQRGDSIKVITDSDLQDKDKFEFITEDDYDRSAFVAEKPKKKPRPGSAKASAHEARDIALRGDEGTSTALKKNKSRSSIAITKSSSEEMTSTPTLQKKISRRSIVPGMEIGNGAVSGGNKQHLIESAKSVSDKGDSDSPSRSRRSIVPKSDAGVVDPTVGTANPMLKRGSSRRSLLPPLASEIDTTIDDTKTGKAKEKSRKLKLEPLGAMVLDDEGRGKDTKRKKKKLSSVKTN